MISATMFTDLDQTYSLSEEIEDKVLNWWYRSLRLKQIGKMMTWLFQMPITKNGHEWLNETDRQDQMPITKTGPNDNQTSCFRWRCAIQTKENPSGRQTSQTRNKGCPLKACQTEDGQALFPKSL